MSTQNLRFFLLPLTLAIGVVFISPATAMDQKETSGLHRTRAINPKPNASMHVTKPQEMTPSLPGLRRTYAMPELSPKKTHNPGAHAPGGTMNSGSRKQSPHADENNLTLMQGAFRRTFSLSERRQPFWSFSTVSQYLPWFNPHLFKGSLIAQSEMLTAQIAQLSKDLKGVKPTYVHQCKANIESALHSRKEQLSLRGLPTQGDLAYQKLEKFYQDIQSTEDKLFKRDLQIPRLARAMLGIATIDALPIMPEEYVATDSESGSDSDLESGSDTEVDDA